LNFGDELARLMNPPLLCVSSSCAVNAMAKKKITSARAILHKKIYQGHPDRIAQREQTHREMIRAAKVRNRKPGRPKKK
jgi:hypothetical protein